MDRLPLSARSHVGHSHRLRPSLFCFLDTLGQVFLTVRLLISCPGARSAELLGLAAPRVGNQQGAVELHQDVLDLLLALLVDVWK